MPNTPTQKNRKTKVFDRKAHSCKTGGADRITNIV
jgi:hypothetical protein